MTVTLRTTLRILAGALIVAGIAPRAGAQTTTAPAAAPTSAPSATAGADARIAALEQEIGELRATLARLTTPATVDAALEDRIRDVDQQVKVLARKIELEK